MVADLWSDHANYNYIQINDKLNANSGNNKKKTHHNSCHFWWLNFIFYSSEKVMHKSIFCVSKFRSFCLSLQKKSMMWKKCLNSSLLNFSLGQPFTIRQYTEHGRSSQNHAVCWVFACVCFFVFARIDYAFACWHCKNMKLVQNHTDRDELS